LLCLYGIDRGNFFELMLQRQLPENRTAEELHKIAQNNLLKFIETKLQIHKTDFGGYGFTCGGEYEAALLTLPEIWNLIVERLGNTIVFGVPSKDMIVFVNSNNQTDIEGLEKLILEIHAGGGKLLSKHLFKFEKGNIELYR